MTDHHFQEIIARYLNGEAGPAEIRLVDRWYRSFGQQIDLLPAIPASELRQSMGRGFDVIREAISAETAGIPEKNVVNK